MHDKTIIGFGLDWIGVISLAFGLAGNSYLDIDNSVYHKNLIQ